jgi:hypothetical protein
VVAHRPDAPVQDPAVAPGAPGRVGYRNAAVSPDRYGRPHAGLSRGGPGSVTLEDPRVVELSSWIVDTSPPLRWIARTTR